MSKQWRRTEDKVEYILSLSLNKEKLTNGGNLIQDWDGKSRVYFKANGYPFTTEWGKATSYSTETHINDTITSILFLYGRFIQGEIKKIPIKVQKNIIKTLIEE